MASRVNRSARAWALAASCLFVGRACDDSGFTPSAGPDAAEDASLDVEASFPDAEPEGSADASQEDASDAPMEADSTGLDAKDAPEDGSDGTTSSCAPESLGIGSWTSDHLLAASSTHVFLTAASAGQTSLRARLKTGGPVAELSTLAGAVSALVATDSTLYLLRRGSATEDGALLAYSLPSGPLATLANAPGPLESLAIDSTHAYVARRSDSGAVLRVGLNGGSFEALASNITKPWQLALSSTDVYWLGYVTPSPLWTVPKAGGAPSQVLTGVGKFAVDETNLYYSQNDYLKVRPIVGGTPWTLAQAWPGTIVSRGAYLFLKGYCSVVQIAKTGGVATAVVSLSPCSAESPSLAVDDGCVYFLHATGTPGVAPEGGPPVWSYTGYLDRYPH